jgi:hypothetical protein
MRAVTALLLLCCKAAALAPRPLDLRFDHVQIFADAVAPLEHYAAVEAAAGGRERRVHGLEPRER